MQLKKSKGRSRDTNRWVCGTPDESSWSPWCIWSFRIHAAPLCLTWLIKREGARLPVLDLSPPAWQLQSPEKRSHPRLHLCQLLIEPICGRFHHSLFKISFGEEEHILSAEGWRDCHENNPRSPTVRDERLTNSSLMEADAAELSHLPMSEWCLQPRESDWVRPPCRPQYTESVIRKWADGDILQISSHSSPAVIWLKINEDAILENV